MGGNIDFWATQIQHVAEYAHVWGFLIIFVFMAVESSFIPFPSEVVLIPAGFLAYRGGLNFASPGLDFSLCVVAGMTGSVAGAFFNYYLSLYLGRPFLYKYGKYFFIKPKFLERSEELFREYGDIVTFICRFLPAIRHLISIPAGLSKMSKIRFAVFTALGSGIWSLILTAIGFYIGSISKNMSYKDLVKQGKNLIVENYLWLFIAAVLLFAVYIFIHLKVMKSSKKSNKSEHQQ